jgi:hypothetical protein
MTADAVDDEKHAAICVDVMPIFILGAQKTGVRRGRGVHSAGACEQESVTHRCV